MDKLEDAGQFGNSLHVERPYYEPGLLLGASAFTAAGWEGSFYPAGMKARDFLSYYSSQFAAVEIDSTFMVPLAPLQLQPGTRKLHLILYRREGSYRRHARKDVGGLRGGIRRVH
jgi:hypothetical protein